MEICFRYNLVVSAPESYLEYPAWKCPYCDMYYMAEDWERKTLSMISALSCNIYEATRLKQGRYWFACPNCNNKVLDDTLAKNRRGREE